MSQRLVKEFELYFSFIAKDAIEYYESSFYELIIKLNDGSYKLYDSSNKTIRTLPNDDVDMDEENYRKEFATRLRNIMHRKGITQNDLSERTGITKAMINRYMAGQVTPSSYNSRKIAKVIGCSSSYLCYDCAFTKERRK